MIEIRLKLLSGALVVTPLARRLDAEAALALRQQVAPRAAGRALVVVSLAEVEALDCSGLAGLVTVYKRLAPGGALRLVGVPASGRRLLEATGLREIFQISDRDDLCAPPREQSSEENVGGEEAATSAP